MIACSSLRKSYRNVLTGHGTAADFTDQIVFVSTLSSSAVHAVDNTNASSTSTSIDWFMFLALLSGLCALLYAESEVASSASKFSRLKFCLHVEP